MGSYLRKDKESFTNGTFQVWIGPDPSKITFGFGNEYTFDPEDLSELIAFLINRGLLLVSTSAVLEEQPSTGETPGG